jgi:two-component system response regulator YesN
MRVLVVDDEVLVRIGMKSIIDWESYGHEIVGEAENGEEAYDKVVRLHPDLVITDIRMPVTDGLELIRDIVEYDPDIKIVVLSGFDEYHLVREAMKLGAVDYLLKLETDPERLLELLRSIDEPSTIDLKAPSDRLSFQREAFLKRAVSERIEQGEFARQMSGLGFGLSGERLSCLVFRVGAYRAFASTGEKELFRLVESIRALLREAVPDTYSGVSIEVKTGEFALFLSAKEPVSNEQRYSRELESISKSARDLIKRCLGFEFDVRAGTDRCSADGLRAAFDHAVAAFGTSRSPQGALYSGTGGGSSDEVELTAEEFSVLTYRSELLRSLARHDRELLDSVFDDISSHVERGPVTDERHGRIASEIVFMLADYFGKYGLRLDTIITPELIQFATMKSLSGREELRRWLSSVLEQLQSYLNDRTLLHPRIVERAKEYMAEHFSEPITLNEIAEEIHLSPNYFCSLFKKYEGVGFVAFLNGVRIEQAKKLLRDTDDKVYQIALKVGFQNNHYFNRIFKKYAGHTPSEYRDLSIV